MADDMILGTSRARLASAMATATEDPAKQDYTFQESNDILGKYRESSGIDNPYGQGVSAYEPHTVLFDGYSDAYGKVQASKQKDEYDAALKSASSTTYDFRTPGVDIGSGVKLTNVPYADEFAKAGAKYGISPALLAAVARAESAFNPSAKSSAGAIGLMQFMPATARSLGINPLDPASAIDGAARYLRKQLDTFGTPEMALAAYNAGPGAVTKYGGIPPYKETQGYVSRVLGYANEYGSATTPTDTSGKTLGEAHGQIGAAINAALDLAHRRVRYVWGGTSRNGVDCSGLLYYAFNAAGIKVPRYRASDWGRIGTAVTAAQARPGDVVYYDAPGDTDHVGIYIGGGKMIQAPTSGDVVRVSYVGRATSYRRIFDDNQFTQVAQPGGSADWQYGRTPATTANWAATSTTPLSTIRRTTTQFQNAL